jgi:hypothetical protein
LYNKCGNMHDATLKIMAVGILELGAACPLTYPILETLQFSHPNNIVRILKHEISKILAAAFDLFTWTNGYADRYGECTIFIFASFRCKRCKYH